MGELFGNLYYVRSGHLKDKPGKHHILGNFHKETWLESIRSVVLDGAAARFPKLAEGGYLVIKEPNGSIGAPLLMEALPESRMIFLIRDPRDVVASAMDALRKDSWGLKRAGTKDWGGARYYNRRTQCTCRAPGYAIRAVCGKCQESV